MRIAVLAPDIPFPAHRGGRADVWRRILALRALGHEVFLVHAEEASGPAKPQPAAHAAIEAVVSGRFGLPLKRSAWRTLRQLAGAWRLPWHAAMRVPDAAEWSVLAPQLHAFKPDLVWLEGPWFGVVAQRLARRGVPFAYRSHNVEHEYLWKQAQVAVRLRDRIAWRLVCIGLARWERQLMDDAAAVFDISLDDLAYWQRAGVQRLHWLPPLPQTAVEPASGAAVAGDVVFVGNLATPNNVRGVEFLLRDVWPGVLARRPGARLAIVGSKPSAHVQAMLAQADASVEGRIDVPDTEPHLRGARVLVNPVLTGSGVQLKLMDMLMTDAHVITTRQGVRGLPADVVAAVRVAEDRDDFVDALVAALDAPLPLALRTARDAARRRFGVEAVGEAVRLAAAT